MTIYSDYSNAVRRMSAKGLKVCSLMEVDTEALLLCCRLYNGVCTLDLLCIYTTVPSGQFEHADRTSGVLRRAQRRYCRSFLGRCVAAAVVASTVYG